MPGGRAGRRKASLSAPGCFDGLEDLLPMVVMVFICWDIGIWMEGKTTLGYGRWGLRFVLSLGCLSNVANLGSGRWEADVSETYRMLFLRWISVAKLAG